MKKWMILLSMILFLACGTKQSKVFYINSYHIGFESSDETMAGIKETFAGHNIQMKTFIMDTKQNPNEDFIQRKADEAVKLIKAFDPDVIIASDDNAIKYIIEPYFKDGPIPVLFCGVNWNCDQYGLPTQHVTGMLEVLPVQEIIQTLLNYYPEAKSLTILSENTNSERKNKEILDPLYRKLGLVPSYSLVNTFEEWQAEFLKANENADLIFFLTNGAIKGWDDNIAKMFITKNIRKPVFTVEDFIMPFAVIGFTKIAKEQGQWVARNALNILNGGSIDEIDLARNKQTAKYINLPLAEKINFRPDNELLEICQKVE